MKNIKLADQVDTWDDKTFLEKAKITIAGKVSRTAIILLNVNAIYSKIRNLKYRYLTENTLFPTEITQYEPYLIREVLHNCIAHQDYGLNSRINVVEKPEELMFTNVGNFIPKTIETVIEQDAPNEYYRNQFLANAMVNLNMIDKNYTKLLIKNTQLDMKTVMDLDKVQKKEKLSDNENKILKKQKLIGMHYMILDPIQVLSLRKMNIQRVPDQPNN